MENRKKLHDYGLALIFLGILNFFMFFTLVVSEIVDGSTQELLATIDPSIAVAVKVVLGIIGALMVLLVFSDTFIGIKGLKVSKNPTADNGYIIAAKVFFVISIVSAVFALGSLFGSGSITNGILDLANSVLDAAIYFGFIKAANDVRRDVLEGAK